MAAYPNFLWVIENTSPGQESHHWVAPSSNNGSEQVRKMVTIVIASLLAFVLSSLFEDHKLPRQSDPTEFIHFRYTRSLLPKDRICQSLWTPQSIVSFQSSLYTPRYPIYKGVLPVTRKFICHAMSPRLGQIYRDLIFKTYDPVHFQGLWISRNTNYSVATYTVFQNLLNVNQGKFWVIVFSQGVSAKRPSLHFWMTLSWTVSFL